MTDFEDFEIDVDDELFFRLPEDGEGDVEIDCVWKEVQDGAEPQPQPSTSQKNPSKATKRPSSSKSSSNDSSKKSKKSAERLPCSHCSNSNTYANERTLKSHLNSVRLKDLARRAPYLSGLTDAMPKLFSESLTETKKKLKVGYLALRCSEYVDQILSYISNCQHEVALFTILATSMSASYRFFDTVFLSSLRMRVITETNKLLHQEEFVNSVKEELSKMGQCRDTDLNFLIGILIMDLSERVLRHACQEMMDCEAPYSGPKKRSKDDLTSVKFSRLVHYIGGSVIAGVKRRQRNYPKSTKIVNFNTIMQSQFIEDADDLSTLCDPEVKEWTSSQDRGGLSHISMDAFNFFHMLISFVMCFEEVDGSLLIQKVISAVSGHVEILGLWDALIGGLLEEDSSLEWLAAIVEIICRCISKGIVKRRLNEAIKKPKSNVAHRSKLARN